MNETSEANLNTDKRILKYWPFLHGLYVNGIRECAESAKVKYRDFEDYWLSWDLIKMELRGYTIAFSK